MTPASENEMLAQLQQENALLREQVRLLVARLYGRKSEKFKRDGDVEQFVLFEAPDPEEGEKPAEERPPLQEVTSHKRRKPGRKPLPESLPRVLVVHDLDEADKRCGCGSPLVRIGEVCSEQLDMVPARIQVLRHVRPKYTCRGECEAAHDGGPAVAIAPLPAQLIPKSLASAGLIAHIATAKFADSIPLYRQESQLARLGIRIGRNTMCGWLLRAAKTCLPLMALLREELLSGPVVNCDETTLQVLVEEGRDPTDRSYIWLMRGGTEEQPCVEFIYDCSREGEVAARYLQGFRGFVQTDGYKGYDFLDAWPDTCHLGCWAHVRRKFVDVLKAVKKEQGPKPVRTVAEEAVERIRELYAIEKIGRERGLCPAELQTLREAEARPRIAAMHEWLKARQPQVAPKSRLGQAINYALGQWPRLERYLLDGRLRPDNNLAENAIRPFVVGRKNWLFSATADGARASATFYSLVETAKANGLDPYWYLRYLFERLPHATDEADLRRLLPQHVDREALRRQAVDWSPTPDAEAEALARPVDPTLR